MNASKVQLSEEEIQLVTNSGWLLTKNAIIGKVYALFGEMASDLELKIGSKRDNLPAEVTAIPPKISRGENYNGLPWAMLDYPRCFGKDDVFALRTFFWWGNFFSVTLHLKGIYLEQWLPVINSRLHDLVENDFHISSGNDEWRHDFLPDNYIALSGSHAGAFQAMPLSFCKISSRFPLSEWNSAGMQLRKLYDVLL